MEPVVTGRILAAGFSLAFSVAAWGQETGRPPAGGPGRPRDEAFKMVDAYIVSNLQESLGLTDEQFAKVLPLVMRLHNDRRTLVHRRIQNMRELRRLLASGGATEAQVEERLREAKRLENEEPLTLRRDREAVDATLSPLQQAKFRALEAEVEQKIRGLRSHTHDRARGPHEGPSRPPRPQP
jgi:Spy/CpxP family protein refolding chaperone